MFRLSLLKITGTIVFAIVAGVAGFFGVVYRELYPHVPKIKPASQETCAHLLDINSDGGYFYSIPAPTLYLHTGHGNPPNVGDNAGIFVSQSYSWLFNQNEIPMSFKWGKDADKVELEKPDWAAYSWTCGTKNMSAIFDLRDKSSTSVAVENSDNVAGTNNVVFVPLIQKGREESYAYPPPP